jgi:hypothetical protein
MNGERTAAAEREPLARGWRSSGKAEKYRRRTQNEARATAYSLSRTMFEP